MATPKKSRVDGANSTSSMLYIMHRYLLYFRNSEVARKYFNFQYVDNAFIPGMIFAATWGGIGVLAFFLFTDPLSDSGAYMMESFIDPLWVGGYIHGFLSIVFAICLFINRLKPYREIIHLAQIATGWPNALMILYT